MKKALFPFFLFFLISLLDVAVAQDVLKPRPDAFPPEDDHNDAKALNMATTVAEMSNWDRYPTYETYLAMMQGWAQEFPTLCHVDTIGTSVRGRLILSMYIAIETDDDLYRPEFFYSSTMHGDEITGYVMMLRLIDTLLRGYGTNEQYTRLINRTRISINPLSNPDGTYHSGNNTVSGSIRYNADSVDLNRNYPDPFGTPPFDTQQVENTAMIDYMSAHNFRLSANLHGGSEVLNYPWDSFTSTERRHPKWEWWIAVCKRFIDTSRAYNSSHFRDVNSQGYIAGGDWYVIPNGRQDYINDIHDCLEMTLEISSEKKLNSTRLPEYWSFLQHSLVNYIEEIHNLDYVGIDVSPHSVSSLRLYPNHTRDIVFLGKETSEPVMICDVQGRILLRLPAGTRNIDMNSFPQGVYIVCTGAERAKIIKQ